MRRLPMTSVGQRICGVEGAAVNCGLAATCAWARAGMLDRRSKGRRSRKRLTERRKPRRLERMRTGWDVHFRELALTRIPVKITTPSLHLALETVVLHAFGGKFDYRRHIAPRANRGGVERDETSGLKPRISSRPSALIKMRVSPLRTAFAVLRSR